MPRLRPSILIAITILGSIYYFLPKLHLNFNLLSDGNNQAAHSLFHQVYDDSNPSFHRLSNIAAQCGRTHWHDQIYLECQDIAGGMMNVISSTKTCFKMAIDLGYNVILPTMKTRDGPVKSATTHLSYGDWFDEEFLVSRLSLACPQMKVARLNEDKTPDLTIRSTMKFDIASLPHYSQWGYYAWSGNDWHAIVQDYIDKEVAKLELGFGSIIVPMTARQGFYSLTNDSSGHDLRVWNDLNYLMRAKAEIRTVIAQVLKIMDKIPKARPFFGVHFRVEKDVPEGFVSAEEQRARLLDKLEEVWKTYRPEGRMIKIAYIACGDRDQLHMLREEGAKKGWFIADKRSMAGSNEETDDRAIRAIDALSFDQQGIADFGMLLLSEFFIGSTASAFSYSQAHARDPSGRYSGSSITRYNDADSRLAASHLFMDGEGSHPCCL